MRVRIVIQYIGQSPSLIDLRMQATPIGGQTVVVVQNWLHNDIDGTGWRRSDGIYVCQGMDGSEHVTMTHSAPCQVTEQMISGAVTYVPLLRMQDDLPSQVLKMQPTRMMYRRRCPHIC